MQYDHDYSKAQESALRLRTAAAAAELTLAELLGEMIETASKVRPDIAVLYGNSRLPEAVVQFETFTSSREVSVNLKHALYEQVRFAPISSLQPTGNWSPLPLFLMYLK
jgi:hypothetical protein